MRLAADSLLVDDSLQPQPLVDPDRVLMSVEVPAGQVPVGLREQSRLVLVVTPPGGPSDVAPVLVEAVVAAVPRDLAEVVGAGGDSRATVALSVEVPPADVALVGSAEAVSVGVLDPSAAFPVPAVAPTTVAARRDEHRRGVHRAGHRGGDHHGAPARCDGAARPDAAGGRVRPFGRGHRGLGRPRPRAGLVDRSRRAAADVVGHRAARPGTPERTAGDHGVVAPLAGAGSITRAATSFASMLAATPEVLAVADCGRVDSIAPAWVGVAQLSLLLVRQAPTAGATVARVDRAIEVLDVLSAACPRVGVVLIGRAPYPPAEVEAALGMALFATLPEDPAGAALACGGWTIGRGAGRSALAKAAAVLARRAVEAVGDVDAGLVLA